MSSSYCILHLEDSDLDAEFVRERLQRAQVPLAVERVGDRAAYVASLRARRYDLILSDYQVPTLRHLEALDLAREFQPAVPFLFVSGAIGEELAVESLKRGATDYILKERLARLPAAVERALAEAAAREERRAAEAVHRETEGRLRFAYEAANLGAWELDLNTGRIASTKIFRTNFGFADEAAVTHAQLLERIHPHDRDAAQAALRRSIEEKSNCDFEFRVVRPDDAVRWLNLRGRLVIEPEGRAVRMSGVSLDITERKQAEEALRRSEERFRLLADSIPNLAWMARPDGHVLWYNTRWYEYTGTCDAEMVGWGWQTVHDPAMLPAVLERWKQSIATGEPFEMVFPLRGADGTFRPFLTRVLPFRDEVGRIVYWFGTNTDISTQKQAEERLLEADRRKDEFLATLAHELRNPLAPVRTGLEILKASPAGSAATEKAKGMMERQLAHMVRLVDDLLDVSRVSLGKIQLKQERTELRTILDTALEVSRPLIDGARHQLVVSLPQTPLWLNGDPTRLAQVVANLLNNAAKYTPEGGQIGLSANRDDSDVVIRIHDNGAGIPADMLPKVFDLFTQVGKSIERAKGGLGIGLSLVRKLVELHGGSVSGDSPGLGRGSTFVVRLPLASDRIDGATPHHGNGAPRHAPARRRVLIVDDNIDGAVSLAMFLGLRGHETEIAHNGPEAMEAARRFQPDVAILDIGLPGLNGYDLARAFRNDRALTRSILIALTGWGSEDDKRLAREAGFDLHLTKPVQATAVEDILRQFPDAPDSAAAPPS
jgi:PAS domain S-box-containing protein